MAKRRSERSAVAWQFGQNMRRYRQRARLSQEEVAFLASLHRTEIGLLERGERVPGVDTLIRLAAAISTPPGDLLAGIVWKLPSTDTGQIKIEPQDEDENE
jgi:transcriptional regulator with XRE-family HTH domain